MSLRIAGRSSSHFTRVVRVFAHELGITYTFQPVLDLMSLDASDYLGNPALRLPVLETADGSVFGALNSCRELARRSPRQSAVVWPEQLTERLAANAQELVTQGMATEVGLVLRKLARPEQTDAYEDKNLRSLQGSLSWLEQHLPAALGSLPQTHSLSFLETSAYCFLTHLEFRQLVELSNYETLSAFCRDFSERPAARDTSYRYDVSAQAVLVQPADHPPTDHAQRV